MIQVKRATVDDTLVSQSSYHKRSNSEAEDCEAILNSSQAKCKCCGVETRHESVIGRRAIWIEILLTHHEVL